MLITSFILEFQNSFVAFPQFKELPLFSLLIILVNLRKITRVTQEPNFIIVLEFVLVILIFHKFTCVFILVFNILNMQSLFQNKTQIKKWLIPMGGCPAPDWWTISVLLAQINFQTGTVCVFIT